MGLLSALTGDGIIGGVASIAGNLISAIAGHKENKLNREANFSMADVQHEQAREKMQNAYQWAVEDMKKAGLNPALMYNSAAGPNIAGGSGSGNMTSTNPAAGFANMGAQITSALNLKMMESEIEKNKAEADLMENQSGKTRADTLFAMQNTELAKAQTMEAIEKAGLTAQQKRNAKAELQKMYAEMDKIAEEAKIARARGKIEEVNAAFAKAEAIQRQITGYLNSIAGIIGGIKGTSALPISSNSNSNSVLWYGK